VRKKFSEFGPKFSFFRKSPPVEGTHVDTHTKAWLVAAFEWKTVLTFFCENKLSAKYLLNQFCRRCLPSSTFQKIIVLLGIILYYCFCCKVKKNLKKYSVKISKYFCIFLKTNFLLIFLMPVFNIGSDSSTPTGEQGILKGEVSLYHWPVWLVWNKLYENWQFLFLFAKQTNPNQLNRRSMVPWYFPL